MESIAQTELKRQQRAQRFQQEYQAQANPEQVQEVSEDQQKQEEKRTVRMQNNKSHFESIKINAPRAQTVEEVEKEIQKLTERQSRFENQSTEEGKRLLQRLQRKLEFLKHKEPPRSIQEGDEISLDTVYLYGVDYMSTREVKEYFKKYQEPEVTWINDSACRIKFDNGETAQKVYVAFSLPTHSEDMIHIGEALLEKTGNFDQRNFSKDYGWQQAFSYIQRKPTGQQLEQKLWLRFATEQDIKAEQTKGEDSRYYQLQKQLREKKFRKSGLLLKPKVRKAKIESSFLRKVIMKQKKKNTGEEGEDSEDEEDDESQQQAQQMIEKLWQEFSQDSGSISKEQAKQLISRILSSNEELMSKYSEADFEEAYQQTQHEVEDQVSMDEFNQIAGVISETLALKQ